jgi:hypothetical protein
MDYEAYYSDVGYSLSPGMIITYWVIALVIYLAVAFSLYIIAKKVNEPNEWLAFIPIAQYYLLAKLSGHQGWMLILLFVPILNLIFIIMFFSGLSKRGGYGIGMTIGSIFLPFIFLPILALNYKENPSTSSNNKSNNQEEVVVE